MDSYSGYNQIMVHEDDKAKTSFIIERGTYCYKVMPFGLKNAGATYQRPVNKIFKEQIGKTIEVYIDDMLVKGPERADHIKNLAKAFSLLRKYNMKLNPSKCTFRVSSGLFLGYSVIQKGIEGHPNQIKTILNIKSPTKTKEKQSLTGRAAALNIFLSRSTNKCRPFFKPLKKGHKDKWDDECEVAFQNLKTYLTSPPLLSKAIQFCFSFYHLGKTRKSQGTKHSLEFLLDLPCEDLYIYLTMSDSAVSSALIREELGAQHPVFYTSKALFDAETRYPKMEKLNFSLVVSVRKLRPYYQAQWIIVMTKFPLRSILHSPDVSQQLMKWAIELSQYDLLYGPKTSIKAQALANFVEEFTAIAEEEKMVTKSKEKADDTSPTDSNLPNKMWQLHVDGASNHKRAGAGVVIITPDGTLLEQAITLGIARSTAPSEYVAKHPRMVQYLDKVHGLLKEFPTFTIQQVPRAENTYADALASLGSALVTQFKRSIQVEHLDQPSINEIEPIGSM
ncbi:hypothetical protein L3X38_024277 [Prunus dulcis]|uniref:Reverse transcriptase domain-containing protein n=1 Tax=Prunus dulcis TaxID=3755 RepID=A0AAD4W145_PRUDU|nr:hypothetical protein L3X38_024277 [Prunus dulcis]